ncbi:MAG: organic solvent transporter substrate-binding protein [Frankiales bacterium]|nr:organic solvent transporter substrate-binding protein [Frankiales bacterium]
MIPQGRDRKPALVGIGMVGLFGLSLGLAFTIASNVPGRHYTVAKASFSDVGGLRVGDDVRENSVRIGQVRAIDVGEHGGLVTLQIDGQKELYSDAKAALRARSSLGQTYVDLAPGTAAKGALPKAGIPVAATSAQTQLDDVLNVFDTKTRKQAADVLATTGHGVAGHSQDVNDFLANGPDTLNALGAVTGAAASKEADVTSLIATSGRLASRVSDQQAEIAGLVRDTGTVLGAVATEDGTPLQQTLVELPSTLAAARVGLHEAEQPLQDTADALTALRPAARDLGAVTPALRKTVRDLVPPLEKVPGVAGKTSTAVTSLRRTATDLRPLAPKITKGLSLGNDPLEVLAPYGLDIGLFFDSFARTVENSNPDGSHYVRIDVTETTQVLSGNVPVADPLSKRDPYPKPRTARGPGAPYGYDDPQAKGTP